MASFHVLATNHTSFTVSSLDRTLAFFRDVMGFAVTTKAPRSRQLIESVTGVEGADVLIAYVKGPGHVLELIEYVGPDGRGHVRPRPCDVGFAHVAYDVDDVDAAVAAAATHGFAPLGGPAVVDQGPNRTARVVYLRDADGLTVELLQRPRAS
jgi:catechol 2,3-dioxygenase-like lactoylglutathione lyase family enzyme